MVSILETEFRGVWLTVAIFTFLAAVLPIGPVTINIEVELIPRKTLVVLSHEI